METYLRAVRAMMKFADVATKLKPHQQRVVDRMKEQEGLVVAHGLGSGKTLSSIAAQDALGLHSAVIVPGSLQTNYEKERKKHLVGSSPEAAITSLQRVARSGKVPIAPLAIVDEAHRAREVDTKTYKALKKALEPTEKRMLLTASPFYNRPSDIASLINLAANEQIMAARPQEFNKRYVRERVVKPGFIESTFRGTKPGVVQELNPAKRQELRRTFRRWVDYHPNSVEGFPSVDRINVAVPMTKKQLEIYDAVMDQAPPWVARKVKKGLPPSKAESAQLNAFATAVRQVSLSTRPYAPKEPPQEPKIDVAFQRMKETIEKSPRAKGVVYSNYLAAGLTPYKERLEKANIPYGEFTGQLKKKERDKLVREYNSGKRKVLLVSSAGGEGLDLKGTRVLQVLEPHWNAEKLKQVEGRGIRYQSHAHLPPKERRVLIENYVATRPRDSIFEKLRLTDPGGGVDEYLTARSNEKERLIGEFRDLMKNVSEDKPGGK